MCACLGSNVFWLNNIIEQEIYYNVIFAFELILALLLMVSFIFIAI